MWSTKWPRYSLNRFQRKWISSNQCVLPDYYSILNVKRSATLKQIQVSYRKLAKQLHPDVNKNYNNNNNNDFVNINIAYHTLINPKLRRQYDVKQGYCVENMFRDIKYETKSNIKKSNKTLRKKRRNKRESAGDIGSRRNMDWNVYENELYTVYVTDALDAWHLEHHIALEQIDPWKLQ